MPSWAQRPKARVREYVALALAPLRLKEGFAHETQLILEEPIKSHLIAVNHYVTASFVVSSGMAAI